VVVLPCGLEKSCLPSPRAKDEYEESAGLACRLGPFFPSVPFLQSWRSYENVHIVLWMVKVRYAHSREGKKSWIYYGLMTDFFCFCMRLLLSKDYAWNTENQILWLVACVPTVFIGLDFIYTTGILGASIPSCFPLHSPYFASLALLPPCFWFLAENMIVDHIHYIAEVNISAIESLLRLYLLVPSETRA